MAAPNRQIIAMGGGGFMMEDPPLLDDYILAASETPTPRVCFLATAAGDSDSVLVRFYRAFSKRSCKPTHLELFRRDDRDLRPFLLGQDVIYVGGGNTANMLAIWRLHGIDTLLREAWESGVILSGLSAGAVCWFDGGPTDSYGGTLRPLTNGLALIGASFCPHYDGEVTRQPAYHEMIGNASLGDGFAADDSAAIHFVGTEAIRAVSSRRGARAFRVASEGGSICETPLTVEYLGAAI